MRASRMFAGIAAVIVGSLGLVAVTASPAVSAPFGNPPCANWTPSNFVGWNTANYPGWPNSQPQLAEGVSSYLYTRDVDKWCNNGTQEHMSTAWNMVYNPANGRYAQTGNMMNDVDAAQGLACPETFGEYWISTGNHFVRTYFNGSCLPIGSRHAYRALMVPWTDGGYRNQQSNDGIAFATTPYDPFPTWGAGQLAIAFEGETDYQEDQVMGNPTTHESWTAMGVQYWVDDTLHLTCSNAFLARDYELNNIQVTAAASPYATSAIDCSDVDIWHK